ncbi:hypothetical protein Taro_034240 [Colocasia esculenta]|uniref:Uncharacterized protein n=1 Tax=Colocasia esculenta TaxID=4460 RepID=A0A843WBC8_COLES|nr:hypothetical protein [Colocasia esculenta]
MMSRPTRPPRHHRNALRCRDNVATVWAAATMSRQDSGVESFAELSWLAWDTEDGRSSTRCRLASKVLPVCVASHVVVTTCRFYGVSNRGVLRIVVVSSFASALPFVGETSQQWQGVRLAEEMGR